MNPEIGAERAKQPAVDPGELPAPTPLGYSFETLLMLRLIDLTKELLRVIPASFSGKLPPAMPPEPRPQTAEQRIRDAQATANVHSALEGFGVR